MRGSAQGSAPVGGSIAGALASEVRDHVDDKDDECEGRSPRSCSASGGGCRCDPLEASRATSKRRPAGAANRATSGTALPPPFTTRARSAAKHAPSTPKKAKASARTESTVTTTPGRAPPRRLMRPASSMLEDGEAAPII